MISLGASRTKLSPRTACWISAQFGFEARPLRDIGLREAEDYMIFHVATVVSQRSSEEDELIGLKIRI